MPSIIKAFAGLLWHTLKGNTAHVDKQTTISCCKCSARTHAARRLCISRYHGVWLKDAAAPKDWGVRYERQPKGEPLATYYCGPCAEKGA
jgi:hypothetical protein